MKKTIATIIVITLVFSIGIVVAAQNHSTIDGFSSQFVTGDASVETSVLLYNERANSLGQRMLMVRVNVTNVTTQTKNFQFSELILYHSPKTSPSEAGRTNWQSGNLVQGGNTSLTVNLPLDTSMQTEFALTNLASID